MYILMSTAFVKTVKRYGNSGGVYLPAGWVGGSVRVELVKKPLDPKSDLLGGIDTEHVISIILYGSYARREMEKGSDIDVILVVDEDGGKIKIPSEIRQRYDVQVRTARQMQNAMANDPIFHKSIKDSSAAIVNHQFLDDLKNEARLNSDSVRTRVGLAESSLGLTKSIMENYEGSEELIYPLVMRLKEMIILECLFSNKKYNTRMLRTEILDSGISPKELNATMAIYRSIRDNKNHRTEISKDIIPKLILLLETKIKHVKQKTLEKRH